MGVCVGVGVGVGVGVCVGVCVGVAPLAFSLGWNDIGCLVSLSIVNNCHQKESVYCKRDMSRRGSPVRSDQAHGSIRSPRLGISCITVIVLDRFPRDVNTCFTGVFFSLRSESVSSWLTYLLSLIA